VAHPKKILILYASAGHGHEKAARAVEAACRAQPDLVVECVDTLKKTSFGFGARYQALYLFLIRSMPWLWGLFYYLSDNALVYALIRPIRRWVNHAFTGGVERFVAEGSWDTVLSTHFLGTEVVGYLKKKGRTNARLATVITDYLPHSFWIVEQNDVYCVASDETAKELERRGVAPEKIRVTGIPIETKFSSPLSRTDARIKLALAPDLFTVLLTSGGAGVGSLESLVDSLAILEPPTQLLVVCGTNDALRRRLEAKHRERSVLQFFGFVDNIHELMAASDILVGKGGGLTVSESLVMSRPMILIGALPGQETRNVRVLTKKKAASSAHSVLRVLILIQMYRRDRTFYEETIRAIDSIRRPRATDDVLRAALCL